MRSYSIPEKIVKMVKVMYSGSECAVIDGLGVYDWFEIKDYEDLLAYENIKRGDSKSG